jgi:hypothetical protein
MARKTQLSFNGRKKIFNRLMRAERAAERLRNTVSKRRTVAASTVRKHLSAVFSDLREAAVEIIVLRAKEGPGAEGTIVARKFQAVINKVLSAGGKGRMRRRA